MDGHLKGVALAEEPGVGVALLGGGWRTRSKGAKATSGRKTGVYSQIFGNRQEGKTGVVSLGTWANQAGQAGVSFTGPEKATAA